MRKLLACVMLFAVIGFAGCGDSSTDVETQASLVGTWDAQTFNGQPLPYTQTETSGGTTITVVISKFSVTFTPQTFTVITTASVSSPGQPAQTINETSSGTYRVSGSTLFTTEGGVEDSGSYTLSGNTLTLSSPGDLVATIVLKKR
ncbi:MAG: lipocalin family protein [Longimicrobiales bacterium]